MKTRRFLFVWTPNIVLWWTVGVENRRSIGWQPIYQSNSKGQWMRMVLWTNKESGEKREEWTNCYQPTFGLLTRRKKYKCTSRTTTGLDGVRLRWVRLVIAYNYKKKRVNRTETIIWIENSYGRQEWREYLRILFTIDILHAFMYNSVWTSATI